MGAAFSRFPALMGVIWGVFAYVYGGFWWIAGIGVAACGAAWFGKKQLAHSPRAGLFFIELSIGAAITVMALTTSVVAWIGVHADSIFPGSSELQHTLGGALTGAVTTFFAALWTKDVENAEGALWPSTHFKKGLVGAFGDRPGSRSRVPRDTRVYDAVFLDHVRGEGEKPGFDTWGYEARWTRAQIINEWLKANPR